MPAIVQLKEQRVLQGRLELASQVDSECFKGCIGSGAEEFSIVALQKTSASLCKEEFHFKITME